MNAFVDMLGIIILLVATSKCLLFAKTTEKVCGSTYCSLKQSDVSAGALKKMCSNSTLTGRCCFNTTSDTLIAVDLSHCELSEFPKTSELSDESKHHIKWLAVNQNNMTLSHSDLRFFRALTALILPASDSCNSSFANVTELDDTTKMCVTPTDGCTGVTCPMHSHCAPDGPGLNMCLCDEGWNSYRCLKKDGFPVVQWIAGFSVTTIVICVSLKVAQKKSIAKARASTQGS